MVCTMHGILNETNTNINNLALKIRSCLVPWIKSIIQGNRYLFLYTMKEIHSVKERTVTNLQDRPLRKKNRLLTYHNLPF